MVALKMAQDEYTAMENELLKDKNDLKSKLREQEMAHQEVIRQLKMVCAVIGIEEKSPILAKKISLLRIFMCIFMSLGTKCRDQ